MNCLLKTLNVQLVVESCGVEEFPVLTVNPVVWWLILDTIANYVNVRGNKIYEQINRHPKN
jgi:hypothetical protein